MRRMKNFMPGALAIVFMFGITTASPAVAQNQLIFTDDFDDGVLDPAWTVVFGGVAPTTGWDYDESVERGTRLSRLIDEAVGKTREDA